MAILSQSGLGRVSNRFSTNYRHWQRLIITQKQEDSSLPRLHQFILNLAIISRLERLALIITALMASNILTEDNINYFAWSNNLLQGPHTSLVCFEPNISVGDKTMFQMLSLYKEYICVNSCIVAAIIVRWMEPWGQQWSDWHLPTHEADTSCGVCAELPLSQVDD